MCLLFSPTLTYLNKVDKIIEAPVNIMQCSSTASQIATSKHFSNSLDNNNNSDEGWISYILLSY